MPPAFSQSALVFAVSMVWAKAGAVKASASATANIVKSFHDVFSLTLAFRDLPSFIREPNRSGMLGQMFASVCTARCCVTSAERTSATNTENC
jgi:hypothetical protein